MKINFKHITPKSFTLLILLCMFVYLINLIPIQVCAEDVSPYAVGEPFACQEGMACALPVGSKVVMGSTTPVDGSEGDVLYSETGDELSWIVIDNDNHYLNVGVLLFSEYVQDINETMLIYNDDYDDYYIRRHFYADLSEGSFRHYLTEDFPKYFSSAELNAINSTEFNAIAKDSYYPFTQDNSVYELCYDKFFLFSTVELGLRQPNENHDEGSLIPYFQNKDNLIDGSLRDKFTGFYTRDVNTNSIDDCSPIFVSSDLKWDSNDVNYDDQRDIGLRPSFCLNPYTPVYLWSDGYYHLEEEPITEYSVSMPKSIDLSSTQAFDINISGSIAQFQAIDIEIPEQTTLTNNSISGETATLTIDNDKARFAPEDLVDGKAVSKVTLSHPELGAGAWTSDIPITMSVVSTGETFNISYDVNGGVMSGSYPTSYIQGVGVKTLPRPTRDGFDFAGWSPTNNKDDIIAIIPPNGDHDYHLTAQWRPKYIILESGEAFNDVLPSLNSNSNAGSQAQSIIFTDEQIPDDKLADAVIVSDPDSPGIAYAYWVDDEMTQLVIAPEIAGLTMFANEDSSGMFTSFEFETITFDNFDTTNTKYASEMFKGLTNAVELDLSSFDFGNVTDMSGMFDENSSTNLDVIKTPYNIGGSVSLTDVTDMTYIDLDDDFKQYPAGTFITGNSESHTLNRQKDVYNITYDFDYLTIGDEGQCSFDPDVTYPTTYKVGEVTAIPDPLVPENSEPNKYVNEFAGWFILPGGMSFDDDTNATKEIPADRVGDVTLVPYFRERYVASVIIYDPNGGSLEGVIEDEYPMTTEVYDQYFNRWIGLPYDEFAIPTLEGKQFQGWFNIYPSTHDVIDDGKNDPNVILQGNHTTLVTYIYDTATTGTHISEILPFEHPSMEHVVFYPNDFGGSFNNITLEVDGKVVTNFGSVSGNGQALEIWYFVPENTHAQLSYDVNIGSATNNDQTPFVKFESFAGYTDIAPNEEGDDTSYAYRVRAFWDAYTSSTINVGDEFFGIDEDVFNITGRIIANTLQAMSEVLSNELGVVVELDPFADDMIESSVSQSEGIDIPSSSDDEIIVEEETTTDVSDSEIAENEGSAETNEQVSTEVESASTSSPTTTQQTEESEGASHE